MARSAETKPVKSSRSNNKAKATSKATSGTSFPIVGVGASAGGIEAFTALLKALPEQPGLGMVFILHQDPKYSSNLAQILARATPIPVDVMRAGMTVRINHVYVAPADAEVSIENGVLHLHERSKAGTPSVIDRFFRSLAEDQGSCAISVVLSGSASDGALGTKAVKLEDGITFAQDETAKMDSMPRSAIATEHVDFVLPPAEIANELVRIARSDSMGQSGGERLPEQELMKLFTLINTKHNIDFTHYKPSTIERRIRRRMAMRHADTLKRYLDVIRQDPDEAEQLYGDILIRVTGFFRDPDVFAALEREVFPELMRDRGDDEVLRVWVPGCSTGEEVYSMAIALLEAVGKGGFSCPIQIFGTDVSEMAVERARMGLYPQGIAGEVPPDRLRRYFNRVDNSYRISKAVRDCCIFARQNVTMDPPFSKLDLISCRNVMIYFGSVLQKKVISIFHYALRPHGYLLLGSSESIGDFGDLFGIVDRRNKIFQKQTAIPRPHADFTMRAEEEPAHEPLQIAEPPSASVLFREADRVLLNRFGPVGVLVNENLDVLQFRGRTSRYLELPPGTASFNLLKMAREGLLSDLRTAISNARKKRAPERREGARVRTNGDTITVNIEVLPFVAGVRERFAIVLFEEQEPEAQKKPRRKTKEKAEPESQNLSRLKRELEATREYLQSIIEEQEAMNEELRSANEEIQSSNEELQSTNEELETAKEELQSSNEELTTLNEELENRNQQLTSISNDVVNLLSSVEIPIVMLDAGLRIRRFNPGAQQVLNLLPADIGRPIIDIKTTLITDNLERTIHEVIDKLEVREMKVEDRSGRSFSLRIRPYRTTDNRIDGAVLAFINLEEFGAKAKPA